MYGDKIIRIYWYAFILWDYLLVCYVVSIDTREYQAFMGVPKIPYNVPENTLYLLFLRIYPLQNNIASNI